MSKVAIVFWSATGNTETMANCIAEGAGAAATIVPCAEMDAAKLGEYDVVAFGCPAMGAEQLDESEFEPMFEGLICNETPDDDVQAACRKLGADLANW